MATALEEEPLDCGEARLDGKRWCPGKHQP